MDAGLSGPLEWACHSRPLHPEVESGDLHVVVPFVDGALLAVIDGLGHGPDAAVAARLAAETLVAHAGDDPPQLISQCHRALRGTRGAAILVLSLSAAGARVSWAGIGNVEGWLVRAKQREALISHAGVVGYQVSAPRLRSSPLTPGDLFVLATDGIAMSFSEDLKVGRPDQLTEIIFEKHARVTDDALVLVARYGGGMAP
jgi:negative regulator of sigma-B (phosphoserine phosphatase)